MSEADSQAMAMYVGRGGKQSCVFPQSPGCKMGTNGRQLPGAGRATKMKNKNGFATFPDVSNNEWQEIWNEAACCDEGVGLQMDGGLWKPRLGVYPH